MNPLCRQSAEGEFFQLYRSYMATTVRRIGLSQRSHVRKISREEETRARKLSGRTPTVEDAWTRKISRHEEADVYCSPTLYERSPNNAFVRKISRCENDASSVGTSRKPRRKISVYARPEELERRVNPTAVTIQGQALSWVKDFLMRYEPWILASLFFMIISVSIYIVFVEGQSLFAK